MPFRANRRHGGSSALAAASSAASVGAADATLSAAASVSAGAVVSSADVAGAAALPGVLTRDGCVNQQRQLQQPCRSQNNTAKATHIQSQNTDNVSVQICYLTIQYI